eukprot:TRINITY_DN26600_c0_g1_i1.p1 TRINITY_DN26600_c0_g1~~TRINITY_DN26600_c0_g1_i1.p1  ORF type:complete len:218 (-),score=11.17 TRINITY_DN26600_c0_g1_i1:220-873(-)
MGFYFSKVEHKEERGTKVVDASKVGIVYLCIFGPKENGLVNHYAVIIDFLGESTQELLIGTMYHLGARKNERVVEFLRPSREAKLISKLASYYRMNTQPGSILENSLKNPDVCNLTLLESEIMAKHVELSKPHINTTWGTKINCQIYAKSFTEALGVTWPEEVKITGQDIPILVEFYLDLNRIVKDDNFRGQVLTGASAEVKAAVHDALYIAGICDV